MPKVCNLARTRKRLTTMLSGMPPNTYTHVLTRTPPNATANLHQRALARVCVCEIEFANVGGGKMVGGSQGHYIR